MNRGIRKALFLIPTQAYWQFGGAPGQFRFSPGWNEHELHWWWNATTGCVRFEIHWHSVFFKPTTRFHCLLGRLIAQTLSYNNMILESCPVYSLDCTATFKILTKYFGGHYFTKKHILLYARQSGISSTKNYTFCNSSSNDHKHIIDSHSNHVSGIKVKTVNKAQLAV